MPEASADGHGASAMERRTGPSPLVLHMAMARWQYAGALAALTAMMAGGDLPGVDPNALATWQDAYGDMPTSDLSARLMEHCAGRLEQFLEGIERYQTDPFKRAQAPRTVAARCESATALECGGQGPPVVVVPSLINPSWVLDLMPGNSFVGALAQAGHRVFLVDWGAPGPTQTRYSLGDYSARQLLPLLTELSDAHGPAHVIGYCLGGNLALAAALEAQHMVRSFTAIAAPWDFSAMGPGARALVSETYRQLEPVMTRTGQMPADALQALFAQLDPTQMERKFHSFAQLNPADPADRRAMDHFIAVEDWSNSGPPLAAGAAHDCLVHFYQDNALMHGGWVAGHGPIEPGRLECPALVVTAQRDKIVPPASTLGLAGQLPCPTVLKVDAGHVGMMVGARARKHCWAPVIEWVTQQT
ncbi:MAG: alpha/beta fold hydrolase [Pseudomonadota bacterium]